MVSGQQDAVKRDNIEEEKDSSWNLMKRCLQDAMELTGGYSHVAIAIIAVELHRSRSNILVAKYPVGLDMETRDELLDILQEIQQGGVAVMPDYIELHSGQVIEIEVKMRDKEVNEDGASNT